VLFICTANDLSTISPPLRDRMEVIQLAGYTEQDKVQIARRYLVAKQRKANGLRPSQAQLTDPALRSIIGDYTREAGVRNLEREISTIFRKIARRVAEAPHFRQRVKPETLVDYLQKPRFFNETKKRVASTGVATGLAWTPVGGDIMFIETTTMPGTGKLTLTGQLGDVMKESATAAVSFIRSRSNELGLTEEYFAKHDLHIHVPAGAVPKDGPSAGITIATSIVSLLTNRKVHSDIAMTGEITLTGQVLPVGGIKEKVLGAKRAGIRKVLLPRRNELDLDDVPKEVRDTMEFVLVEELSEVFLQALGNRVITPVDLGADPIKRASNVVALRPRSAAKRVRVNGKRARAISRKR
jgi:ATP-dependent Lon protease